MWNNEITLLDREQKHNQTFRRVNEDLEKKEVMAYGVNSPMMNDEPSYFARRERDDAVWKQEDYNKVLHLESVCWWDPKATAEHVPKSWTKIDIALYHGMHVGCDIESTNFQVVLQS